MMKLADICAEVTPLAVDGPTDREITGIAYDSRRVMPGNVFVAVRGGRVDGHRFVEAAIERGAAAVVLEEESGYNPRATRIRVENTRRTLALASAAFYHHPAQQLKVVGVTGTNGKTTTSFMVQAMLEAAAIPTGLLGTVQYQIGDRVIPAARTTPESVEIQDMMSQMLRAGCGAVSLEVSSHALDQCRVDAIDFDAAIFTNLSQDHLDYHHTMQDYFEAKARLFAFLGEVNKAGCAVINVDDEHGRRLVARLGGENTVLTYGVSDDALICAHDVRVSREGTFFEARTPQGRIPIQLPLIGRYNVLNALAAVTTGLALGLELTTIESGLTRMPPVPGRLEAVPVPDPFTVYVDYAHTADALRGALATVGELTAGRVIVVFGCGGDRDQGKREPMGQVAAELSDFAILTSDNPRTEDPHKILAQIEAAFGDDQHQGYQVIEDRREAIERALDIAREGDTILVAGKGHEAYQEFSDTVIPFNDRQVIEEYFAETGWRWKNCA